MSQISNPLMDRLNGLLQDTRKDSANTFAPAAGAPADGFLDPFADADPTPLEAVQVVIAAGSVQEMEDLGVYVARNGSPGEGRWPQEAAAMARDAAIRCLNKLPVPHDFTYDCIPGHAPDGEGLDVYLVRGSAESLQRVNGSLSALGGALGEMTPEQTLYAAERLVALLDDSTPANEEQVRRQLLDELGFGLLNAQELAAWKASVASGRPRFLVWTPFYPNEGHFKVMEDGINHLCRPLRWDMTWTGQHRSQEEAVAERMDAAFGPQEAAQSKRRSPSVHRKRLRGKHGVREGQLLERGHSPASAKRIAARVAELLRGGEGIIEAIERAAQEDVYLEGYDMTLMAPRVQAGITIPRLVEDGWYWKHAALVCRIMDRFLNAGAPLEYAHEVACDTFEAMVLKRDRPIGEVGAELDQKLVAVLKAKFFRDLVGSSTERTSGADWISGVAAELCLEVDPRTGRQYTPEKALEQTFQEWSNMSRANRLLCRNAFFEKFGRTRPEARELAERAEEGVFPVAQVVEERRTAAPVVGGLLAALLSLAAAAEIPVYEYDHARK